MESKINQIIRNLNLRPHPEGGFFKEEFRSQGIIPGEVLPEEYSGSRNYSTSILYLLIDQQVSRFHKISSDEIWYYHAGEGLFIHILDEKHGLQTIRLGPNLLSGDRFQFVVPGGTWFAAEVIATGTFGLAGCNVAPGFDFEDFQMIGMDDLIALFPSHKDFFHRFYAKAEK